MSLPLVIANAEAFGNFAAGGVQFFLNQTFYIAAHEATWNQGMTATPRTHGDRAVDRAYLNSRVISIRGFVSAGSSGGSLPFGQTPTTDVQYLDQLHAMAAFFHDHNKVILDYRNGWLQYGLVAGFKTGQAEGWPSMRACELDIQLEDPVAYAIPLLTATISANALHVTLVGNAPSTNFRLHLRSSTIERMVRVIHSPPLTQFDVFLPAATDTYLTVHGWQRLLYQTDIDDVQWGRWQKGSVLPTLVVGANTLSVVDPVTLNPLNLAAMTSTAQPVQAELTAHSALWLADSLKVPSNLPPGMYDLSHFDVDVYA